jgi:cysteine desulfurase
MGYLDDPEFKSMPVSAYFDWNATAPLRPEARAAMLAALDVVGNPSSPHAEGRRTRAIVEDAREEVATLVGARAAEVVFTSGGTEANNAVLAGGWQAICLAGIEHDSVRVPARGSGAQVVNLPVDASGVVRLAAFEGGTQATSGCRALLSLQLANNETGVLQPLTHAVALAKAGGLSVHTDAVQAAGRVAVDFRALGVDFLTLSSHKLGGPKGVGALVIRDGAALPTLIAGGGQERRRRAGTENVAAIAGFGAAAGAAVRDLAEMDRVRGLRDRLEAEVRSVAPSAVMIAAEAERLPNTTSVALPGTSAETLVIALDLAGVAVSAGAACSSGKVGASHVLEAMGLEPALARAAVRVSLGWGSTEGDVAAFIAAWSRVATRQRQRAVASAA